MRRLITALTTALLLAASAASLTLARQMPLAPAPSPAPPAEPPELDPMAAARSPRHLMRTGEDYLHYGEFSRALAYFREAEKRASELTTAERSTLERGIERARQGLRAPENAMAAPGGPPRRPSRPGAIALAEPPASPSQPPAPSATSPDGIVLTGATGPALAPIPLPFDMPEDPSAPVPLDPIAAGPAPMPSPAVQRTGGEGSNLDFDPFSNAVPPMPDAPEPLGMPDFSEVSDPGEPSPFEEPAPAPVPSDSPFLDPPPPPPGMLIEPSHASQPLQSDPEPTPEVGSSFGVPDAPETVSTDDLSPVPAPTPELTPAPESAPFDPLDLPDLGLMEPMPEPAPAPEPEAALDALDFDMEALGAMPDRFPLDQPEPLDPLPPPAEELLNAATPPSLPNLDEELDFELEPKPEPAPRTVAESPDAPPFSMFDSPMLGNGDEPYPSTLSPELRRQVEQIVRRQDEEGRAFGPSQDLTADPFGEQELGGSLAELPRPPSPTETRPIEVIPVPDEFEAVDPRRWNPRRKYWSSAATCHGPLYFQDATLERYGISAEQRLGPAGRYLSYPIDDPKESRLRNQIAQPFVSAAKFAAQIVLLPYSAVVNPPWEQEYDLGYHRPGDLVPPDTVYVPWYGYGPPLLGDKY